jgi:hypothetical protein
MIGHFKQKWRDSAAIRLLPASALDSLSTIMKSSALPTVPILPEGTVPRWLAGGATLAGSALIAGTASAGTVQIDLAGNEASTSGSILTDNSYGDLTGDGSDDLGTSSSLSFGPLKSGGPRVGIRGYVAGQPVGASYGSNFVSGIEASSQVSSIVIKKAFGAYVGKTGGSPQATPTTTRAFVPVSFTDAQINNGAKTGGLLEVVAENISATEHRIQLVRLVFDDESTDSPVADVETQYPAYYDPRIAYNEALQRNFTAAKIRLTKRIAALEAQIKTLKSTAKPNGPRLNFYGMTAQKVRQIAALNRQIAILKRRIGKS